MSVTNNFRKLRVFIALCFFYCCDLVYSAFRIAWDIVTIKNYSKPGIIKVPLDAKTDLEIAVIANLITFAPGTMVVGLSADRKFMQVHVMFLDDDSKEINHIKTKLESKVLEILQ